MASLFDSEIEGLNAVQGRIQGDDITITLPDLKSVRECLEDFISEEAAANVVILASLDKHSYYQDQRYTIRVAKERTYCAIELVPHGDEAIETLRKTVKERYGVIMQQIGEDGSKTH